MKVFVDNREDSGRVDVAVRGFGLEGCDCGVGVLDVGDYLVDDLVVWEYKTVPDFINSMWDGSLFNEVFNQSERYPFSFLIIEGDFRSFLYKQYYRSGKSRQGRYHSVKDYVNSQLKMVDGAIRRLRTVCNVVQCDSQGECLNEIYEQSLKCVNFKGYGGVVRPSKDYHINPCKSPLMEIKGVGDKLSDRIIDEFGLKCLNDLSSICYDELLNVKGVNEQIANVFWEKVYGYEYSGE